MTFADGSRWWEKKLSVEGGGWATLASLLTRTQFAAAALRAERAGASGATAAIVGPLLLALVAFLPFSAALLAFPAPRTFAEVKTIPVEEIHAGMRGYGLSVFAGTQPERFEIEVLGILANQKPDGSYILARLSGHDLEASGVIAGMSGSPVYLDGRLAGAVAFAWPFATEPIAGITPIAAMRAIATGPAISSAGGPAGGQGVAVELAEIVARRIPLGRVDGELARFARSVSNEGRSALLWGASGFGESSRVALGRLFSAPGSSMLSALGGGQSAALDSDLGPGASVAALFVDGDLRLAATGTVTDRIGDELFAFGHSVVGVSEISMPLAASEVVTVVPSALASFKLANSGPAVGRFERDHTFGTIGRVGGVARTVPLAVRVLSPVERRFDLRIAEMPQFLPALVAIGCLGSWEVAGGTGGARSVDLGLEIDLAGRPRLALEQSFEGPTATGEALGFLISVLSYLSQNDFAPLTITGVEVDVRLHAEPRAAKLAIVRPSRTRLAPGEALDLQIDARTFRGETVRWTERTVVPAGIPDGRYAFLVGDGASADAARLALSPAPPTRIEQALELLGALHSATDLVVLGVLPGAGLSTGGELLPRLPGSMRSIWGATGTKTAAVVRNAIVQNEAHRRDRPLSGLLRVEVDIRRRSGLSGRSESGPGGE